MPYTHRKVGNKECVFKKEDNSKVGCTTGPIEKYLAALHANTNESVDLTEIKKPKIFTYTTYRLPNENELKEVDSCNLTAEEILNGFSYTIVGRGILDDENKNMIIESINRLIKIYPENNEYKKAYDKAKKLESRFSSLNILKGGKADKIRNIDDLYSYWAKKGYANGGISKSLKKELQHEISLGIKIESEHTNSSEKQLEIVFDHLVEDKNYYTKSKPKNWADKEISKETNESTKMLIKRLIRENIGFK